MDLNAIIELDLHGLSCEEAQYRIEKAIYENRVASYEVKGLSRFDAQLQTLEDLQPLYGFDFKEII